MNQHSPSDAEFSTPPTTPMPPGPPNDGGAGVSSAVDGNGTSGGLGPSLSRKASGKLSSLRIESARAAWSPNIVLSGSDSPEASAAAAAAAKARSPDAPRTSTSAELATPRMPDAAAPRSTQRLVNLAPPHQPVPPQSPYFVHSGLDRGVSLSDWLRENGTKNARTSEEMGLSPRSEVFDDDEGEEVESVQSLTEQLAETAVGVREMSKQLGHTRIRTNIRTILIVTKAKDNRLIQLTRELALYLMLKDRKGQSRPMVVYVDAQLRTSRRFDAAGIQRDHPQLFEPIPRRKSSTASTNTSVSSSSSTDSMSPKQSEMGQLRYWTNEMCNRSPQLFDFVVTLGGDGTVLYTSWLFQRIVPPVLPFALGSLGFLTNFDFVDHQTVMDSVIDSGIRVNLRMRFTCTVFRSVSAAERANKGGGALHAVKKAETGEIVMRVEKGGWEALEGNCPERFGGGSRDRDIKCFSTRPAECFEILNDLVVDRGPSPYVSQLELFADEHHLTTVTADGLCIATPTGSTAYSLSAGGSLAHPSIPSMLITPLCPHTLSFRPMLLPDNMELRICVPYNSRSTAWASFDGRGRVELKQGDHIKVTASKYPFPTVCADRASTDWFQSISRTLKWNERERQKSFVVVEENPVAAEEGPDDGFDIDVVEDNGFKSTNDREIPGGGSDSSKDSNVAEGDSPGMRQAHETMLQPEEAALGREKAREGARDDGARLQVSAERAARALAYVNPALRHAPSGPAQSGISSPDRYLHARHVAFTGGPRSAGAPAPRAFRTAERGRDAVGRLRADELRTPTVGDPTRNRLHAAAAPTRSRSMEVRRQHPRAFAVWGHDDSESEGATSEDEM